MNDEKLIWDLLMNGVGNPYGVAGLMGNLFATGKQRQVGRISADCAEII